MTDINPRSIFRLVVAIFGLYSAYSGVVDLFSAVLATLPLIEHTATYDAVYGAYGPRYWCTRGLIEIVFGLVLMAGVFPLENLAYPIRGSDDDEDNQEPVDVPPAH